MTEPTASDDPRPGEGAYLARALREQRISIRGARTHNLKNIDLDLPRNQLVVITGLSGSGKSSLAFDTLYAEGQRRYVESLSAYARQFLGRLDKPDVDLIEGLSPAISIEQKATSHNPRSTVGTVTEIHDYLRLLYARAGTPYCPEHGLPLAAQTVSQMVDTVLALPEDTRLMVLAPVARGRKGEFTDLFAQMQALGYVRFRVDGAIHEVENLPQLKKTEKHDIDVVIDRLKVRADSEPAASGGFRQRLAESFEAALRVGQEAAGADGNGRVLALEMDSEREHLFSSKFACPVCGFSLPELEPRLFSFNSPIGACPTCDGLGQQEVFDPARVVAFPSLSLASGAIKGWDRRNGYYFAMLESLARHYGFDVEAPFESLPERVRSAVLYGSGEEEIAFSYILDSGANKGKAIVRKHPFEGILPNMARRYRETDSTVVREDLARLRSTQPCPDCHGTRLRLEARHVRVGEGEQSRAIYEVSRATLAEARTWFEALQLSGAKAEIAGKVVREIATRLTFLNDVGLNYLSLDRSAETLSGGEAQRIRLASQIGSGLTGVMYVLDEPSIGLHQRDNDRLIATLQHLRDIGNSVIVVEHDEDMIRAADHCVDMGPGAGVHGGRVMAQGTSDELSAHPDSLTGQYLSGARRIPVPARRTPWLPVLEAAEPEPARKGKSRFPETDASRRRAERMAEHRAKQGRLQALRVVGATGHSLKNVSVEFPVGLLTCVTGVSGSGKSTLVNDTLYAAVARQLYRSHDEPAPHEAIEGIEYFDKVINVDQSPIGRTPRSNPATYTGLFTPIRELMAETHTARERGYGPGRFSFNVAGGRCEACQGDGVVKVEMHFLPDVYVPCDVCHGQRYNRETLEVQWKGRNIAQILELTVEDAHAFFQDVPAIARKLQTLLDVGLSYIRLGQAATTLSGGEAQRVKLAQELSKRDTGRTLYILDEPTTGLHFADIDLLLKVLHQLRDAGNTIVVIEHNLDVIKTADWIIDMGPEGGAGGGTVVAEGTPEEVAANPASHTGRYLARYL
ncbi:excinuclease ABC subunit UvrA [Paracidovorax citrulli]|uniref:UvrABC system protein A n=2 Tax=Paracidovorax citrulli TaxID=80869 RepID=A1TWA5_PARC0|nr:excinuclease ABC subunit UvrA [Paracidovorax citrulli]ABM35243.1 Excinuclease ABC subunit A [Paracidovorax citrulli AAC00-1]PVY64699.1 excinuclease ABC subunit A [Paracidovorax citrulli]QCX10601.1 UvrABC system protein A [Paracidovorax citrulli]REG71103.1 excinuclease ABC subunit A [Paracidovorax citrulli]RLJ95656.1 excinuclease ABC subunit A [Paracidovorax citrulli]